MFISIHALLTESDWLISRTRSILHNFNPRSPHGERLQQPDYNANGKSFQSTLSSRRATLVNWIWDSRGWISIHALLTESDLYAGYSGLHKTNFNPRSPHGERLRSTVPCQSSFFISIHALLTESDQVVLYIGQQRFRFQSTLSSRRATWDSRGWEVWSSSFQSTLSSRRATIIIRIAPRVLVFQSTLSSRRATISAPDLDEVDDISIHALLTESDQVGCDSLIASQISIHALLTESDYQVEIPLVINGKISIHALLTESDARRMH